MADSLEADWNAKLRALEEAQTAYESQRHADRRLLDAEEEAKIYALASNFEQLWESPTTTDRELCRPRPATARVAREIAIATGNGRIEKPRKRGLL